ncbi:cyanophycinase [Aestuariibacter halophilus]|uniref:Cyanophycinase n=2 Tax=Fluctibacter halophilus TaxID=226011 RepID=A0ABS8G7M4_9ALTE|nr:cyanophycinase [Aestuariibacter halophilus]
MIFISCFTVSYNSYAQGTSQRFDLLLAGGGLKTCASLGPQNCKNADLFIDAKEKIVYRIDQRGLERLHKNSQFWPEFKPQFQRLYAELKHTYASDGDRELDRSALKSVLEDTKTPFSSLPDPVYFALLDSLEVPLLTADNQRRREQVSLKQTTNLSSVAIYQTFVQQAAMRVEEGHKPRVAVVTASSRDPFEVADFYIEVFRQAGAEVVWLPLDNALRQALDREAQGLNGCAALEQLHARALRFDRQRIYPQRWAAQQALCQSPQSLLDTLASVQGIFFNGGDQSLTLAALMNGQGGDSPTLSLIRQRMARHELIVGGTSAGTAVQAGGVNQQRPIPMLTNGHSRNALRRGILALSAPSQRCSQQPCASGVLADDITIRGSGGTGLFDVGLLDTHFSERDREARLAMAVIDAGQRWGFGVDETTALLVAYQPESVRMHVVGQSGVFAVDGLDSVHQHSRSGEKQDVVIGALAHYWPSGTTIELDKDSNAHIIWPKASTHLPGKPVSDLPGRWRQATTSACGDKKPLQWQQYGYQFALQGSDKTQYYQEDKASYCGYAEWPFVIRWVCG